MINLNELKIFIPDNMPKYIKPFNILEHEKIKIASEKIKDIQLDKESIWTANEYFIDVIWRMIATCMEYNRAGLSAPQIGIFKQFFITRFFDFIGEGTKPSEEFLKNSSFIVVINPSWISNNKDSVVSAYENCLSLPKRKIFVERPYSITAQYISLNMKNENYNIIEELNGWRARMFLHHYDHLLGKTIIDCELSAHHS